MRLQTPQKIIFAAITSLIILGMSGCSDDKEKTKAATEAAKTPISHTLLNSSVTVIEKQKFEHDFANQCVARELKNSKDQAADKERIEQACTCIATFMMKDLTAIEAEKFITEHENAQSLRIKYENAAYHCLQQNAHPKGPDFTRPQQ